MSQELILDRDQLMETLISHVGVYSREVIRRISILVRSRHFDITRAKNDHYCFVCDKIIEKGQSTYARTLFFEGRWTGFRVCGLECLKKLSEQFVSRTLTEIFNDASIHAFVKSPKRKDHSLDEFKASS